MGSGVRHDPSAVSDSYRQLSDKELESFRAVLNRGLRKPVRPPETLASFYSESRGEIIGCTDQDQINDLEASINALKVLPPNGDVPNRPIIVFDRLTLRRLLIVGNTVAMFQNRTPCLLRLAWLMDRSLSRDLFNRFRNDFFALVEVLIGIGDEIIRRTRQPYTLFADDALNPALDPKILLIEPLVNYQHWKTLLDVRSGKARIENPIPIKETQFDVKDDAGWQQTLDEVERILEARRVDVAIAAARKGDAPVINGALENLRKLKFTDIELQSRARFPAWWRDDPVIEHVELIIYNSVYSILLDKQGNPFRRQGIAPHAVLIPDPGDNLLRHFHPPGLYLSVGQQGDYQFAVAGKKVKNLLLAGITSFTRTQSTFTFEHYLQERLMAYVRNHGIHAIAAITVPEAFGTPDLTLSGVKRAIPRLIDETARYMLIDLLKRLGNFIENYADIIKNVGQQVIKEIIEGKVKEWCREWLIKKVGKKFIPGLNVASAISDLIDDEQSEMIRALIACVITVTKSTRQDDLTLSAKITANIAMDKVQEAVIKELVKKGGKLVSKVGKKPPGKDGGADDAKSQQPDASAATKPHAPADATPNVKPAQTPDVPTTYGQGQTRTNVQQDVAGQLRTAQLSHHQPKPDAKPEPKADAGSQLKRDDGPTQEQRPRWRHQQVQQQQTKRPDPPPDPAVNDRATSKKAVDDKGAKAGAEQYSTPPVKEKGKEAETVELQPGVYRRRGAEKKPDAPRPIREDEPERKGDRDKDIDDSRRALTKRGAVDDRGTDPNVHPSQSSPRSIAAARQAGVPDEVASSGYVMTRADVPAAAPDRPVPAGRQAPPPLPTTRPVSRSAIQNTEVQADLELTMRSLPEGSRVVDVRVNQTQTATDGGRAGTNRPDLQLTIVQAELPNGRRVHIEYDRSPPTRALDHAQRIIANDPDAIVILKIIDFEPPNRPRPPARR